MSLSADLRLSPDAYTQCAQQHGVRPATDRLQLNANANAFVPMPRPEITIRWPDGTPVDLVELKITAANNRAPSIHPGGKQHSSIANATGPRRSSGVCAEAGRRGKKRARRGLRRAGERERQEPELESVALPMGPVAPLQVTANRWDQKAVQNMESGVRVINALLNKLTPENFDSIADQLISQINHSEQENDALPLRRVVQLIFEHSIHGELLVPVFARLCSRVAEKISRSVQDDGVRNSEGKPITGGQLFRKYLLNQCQEDFERGVTTAVKAANGEACDKVDEIPVGSNESYVTQKKKHQGLSLVKFIGELFKVQMLTERIMHECVKKLLVNVDNPEEGEIEGLCKLLTTVGALLDVPKARARVDVYFQRMKELTKSQNVSLRTRFVLQDVIELREHKWVSRHLIDVTITQIRESATRDAKSYQRRSCVPHRDSRGSGRDGLPWAIIGGSPGVSRPPRKTEYLPTSRPMAMAFEPTSIFKSERESSSWRTNMFSMLSQGSGVTMSDGEPVKGTSKPTPQRKRAALLPRSKLTDTVPIPGLGAGSGEVQGMSAEEADKKTPEDSKELTKNQNVSSRMQFMLQDDIKLWEREWVPNLGPAAAPTHSPPPSPTLRPTLTTARYIDDLKNVAYPEDIQRPKIELNANAKNGKFRYDRYSFLQSRKVCENRPDRLPSLEEIELVPMPHSTSRRGTKCYRQGSGPIPVTRQASMSLGFGPFVRSGSGSGFSMGSFVKSLGVSKPNSGE